MIKKIARLSLVVSLVMTSTVAHAAESPTKTNDIVMVSAGQFEKEKESIKKLLKVDDSAVVIYGVDINKKEIYKELFDNKGVPMLLGGDETIDFGNGKTRKQKPALPEHPGDARKELKPGIPTDLTFYNYQGRIFVSDGTAYVPKSSSAEFLTESFIKKQYEKDGSKLDDFKRFKSDIKEKINTPPKKSADTVSTLGFSSNAQLRTTIHQNNYFYDDSLFYDLDMFDLGHSTTDYTIWDNMDSDPSYDHLTVEVRTMYSPNYDNRILYGGVYGATTPIWTGDDLIDYQPSTSGLNLSDNQEYNFQIGLPASINIQAKWTTGATVKMTAVGNRDSEYYYQQFDGVDWSKFYQIGTGDPFDVFHATTYKVTGHDLGLWVITEMKTQWFNESTWKWNGGNWSWQQLYYNNI